MQDFTDNLELGIWHIADINAYDHLLFLLALCAVYDFKQIRKVVILATAFTIGHSITLIIAGLDLFRFKTSLVEFLIPVTIIISAITNMASPRGQSQRWKYALTAVFGLIHGLGFSSFFRMIRNEKEIVMDLLAFNLGVEIGQIIIIIFVLLFAALFQNVLNVKHRDWVLAVSSAALGASLVLAHQTWPF
jgi:hypothetical protein